MLFPASPLYYGDRLYVIQQMEAFNKLEGFSTESRELLDIFPAVAWKKVYPVKSSSIASPNLRPTECEC